MKKTLLTALMMLMVLTTTQAQQTVRRYLRLTDSNLNLNYFGDANSRNLAQNTLTLGDSWCAAGWSFESSPLDLSGYDKLVVRLNAVTSDTYEVGEDGGSAAEFRLFDANSYWDSQASVYCWRVMADQMEFEIPLNEEIYKQNDEPLNLQHVTIACFWCYAPCTIHIKEIYMEKTLKDGEKEYDTTPFPMTQQGMNYKSDDITVDEAGWTLPIYTNESFAGWDWSAAPQDWSAFRYLVIVPQVPYNPSPALTKPFQIHLSDGTLHFRNADLRHFEWNRRRAMVIDLQNMSQYEDTDDEAETHQSLANFKVNAVQALWVTTALGDGSEKDFGVSAIYLTNTAPTAGLGFIQAQTEADFIKGNDAPDQFYTVCLPFNAAVCGAYAYSVKSADKEQKKVVLQRETGILKAGVPYILMSNMGGTDGLGNITFYRAGVSEAGEGQQSGALQGVFLRKKFEEADATKAVLNEDGKWVAVEADAIATANGAYLDITKLIAVTATDADVTMDITADISNIGTGINTVYGERLKVHGYYNLAGQRISQPVAGQIYIMNGRKYIGK